MPAEEFMYVKPVEGHLVARYGSGGRGRPNMVIGAVRGEDGYVVDTAAVVRIPMAEWGQYRKEYMRAVKGKALEVVDRKAYEAAQAAAAKAAEEKAAAEAAKAAAEAAKAAPEKPKRGAPAGDQGPAPAG